MFAPIDGKHGGTDQYELRRDPDGVDRVYRRPIPRTDDGAISFNDRDFIVGIHES
jgi:hypothetical protein